MPHGVPNYDPAGFRQQYLNLRTGAMPDYSSSVQNEDDYQAPIAPVGRLGVGSRAVGRISPPTYLGGPTPVVGDASAISPRSNYTSRAPEYRGEAKRLQNLAPVQPTPQSELMPDGTSKPRFSSASLTGTMSKMLWDQIAKEQPDVDQAQRQFVDLMSKKYQIHPTKAGEIAGEFAKNGPTLNAYIQSLGTLHRGFEGAPTAEYSPLGAPPIGPNTAQNMNAARLGQAETLLGKADEINQNQEAARDLLSNEYTAPVVRAAEVRGHAAETVGAGHDAATVKKAEVAAGAGVEGKKVAAGATTQAAQTHANATTQAAGINADAKRAAATQPGRAGSSTTNPTAIYTQEQVNQREADRNALARERASQAITRDENEALILGANETVTDAKTGRKTKRFNPTLYNTHRDALIQAKRDAFDKAAAKAKAKPGPVTRDSGEPPPTPAAEAPQTPHPPLTQPSATAGASVGASPEGTIIVDNRDPKNVKRLVKKGGQWVPVQ